MWYSFRFDNTVILLVSGVVLIFVFILTLVYGIIRIVNTAPQRLITSTASSVVVSADELLEPTVASEIKIPTDRFALAEDVIKLSIELVFTLLAILATFALYRYVKAKYAAVPTRE